MKMRFALVAVLCGTVAAMAPAGGQTADAAKLIAAAVLPLPEQLRAGASVVRLGDKGKETVLRTGSNGMGCVNATTETDFVVYCYKEPFIRLYVRAAQLAVDHGAMDMSKHVSDAVEQEIKAGKLTVPREATVGFVISGPLRDYNAAANTYGGKITAWQVVTTPFASAESLGLPTERVKGMAWMMHPGTWMAHIMIEH